MIAVLQCGQIVGRSLVLEWISCEDIMLGFPVVDGELLNAVKQNTGRPAIVLVISDNALPDRRITRLYPFIEPFNRCGP